MAVTIAMFVGFARGRLSVEIVSLLTIAAIAVGLYFFPLEGTSPTDGLALAFGGFGHYALITICALMIMGRGLVVTGALDPAARFLEQRLHHRDKQRRPLDRWANVSCFVGFGRGNSSARSGQ